MKATLAIMALICCGCTGEFRYTSTTPASTKQVPEEAARLEYQALDSPLPGRQYIIRDTKTGVEFLYMYDGNNSCIVALHGER